MEETKKILQHYSITNINTTTFARHSHDPDMWSCTFSANKKYVLVQVEAVGSDLTNEEYKRLQGDLGITKESMKLVLPKLEQMRTNTNQASIGIDGHKTVTDQEDLSGFEPKRYKNPNGLDTGTTWVLYKLV